MKKKTPVCPKILFRLLITVLFAWQATVIMQAYTAKSYPISLPKGTIEGTLDNGLHYIILPNDLPKHDVEIRLVMRVGSLMETDRQKGSAHFLEHSAFIGTKHFP